MENRWVNGRSMWLSGALLVTALAGFALALTAHEGGRTAAAQSPPAPLSDEAWIASVVERTGGIHGSLTAEEQRKLGECLTQQLAAGAARYDALRDCYIKVNSEPSDDPDENDDAPNPLEAIVLASDAYNELTRLINARYGELLVALRASGATDEQIEQIRGPLLACLRGWGYVAGTYSSGNSDPVLDEAAVIWCAADLPQFDALRPQPPQITAASCPEEIFAERSFTCTAVIDGKATTYVWTFGDATVTTASPAVTTTLTTAGPVSASLLACNGEPEPQRFNCAHKPLTFTLGASLPVVTSPGCPATAPRGQAVTCTPTGVRNTTTATAWGWTATSAELLNDSQPTLTVTFTLGGVQSVTVIACNGARACSDPVTQGVQVTEPQGPAQSASVKLDKSSFQSGEAIRYCYTLPAAGPVRFLMTYNTGVARTLFDGSDDGRGDCLTDRVLLPQGTPPTSGCIRMEYSNPRPGAEQACFSIMPGATPSPSPAPSTAPSASGGPSTAVQTCNWAGTWAHGPRGLPNLVLTLSGNSLNGTFGGFGRVSGTVSGNSFQGSVTNDRGQRENLEMRVGFSTDGGGRLGSFLSCSYMAVKVGNQGWTDFQR